MSGFATGHHGVWFVDCVDGKRRPCCHFSKIVGTAYIDKTEEIPPGQRWHDFFEEVKQIGEVVFQLSDNPITKRRTGYVELVFDAYDINYDAVLMTWSFKFKNPRKLKAKAA
jgi:hypothetical protein